MNRKQVGADKIALWYQTSCGVTVNNEPYLVRFRAFRSDSVTGERDPPAEMLMENGALIASMNGSLLVTDSLYMPRRGLAEWRNLSTAFPELPVLFLSAVKASSFLPLIDMVRCTQVFSILIHSFQVPSREIAVPGAFVTLIREGRKEPGAPEIEENTAEIDQGDGEEEGECEIQLEQDGSEDGGMDASDTEGKDTREEDIKDDSSQDKGEEDDMDEEVASVDELDTDPLVAAALPWISRFERQAQLIQGQVRPRKAPTRYHTSSRSKKPQKLLSTVTAAAAAPVRDGAALEPPVKRQRRRCKRAADASVMGISGHQVEVFVISRSRFRKNKLHYTLTNAFKLVCRPTAKKRRGWNLPYRIYNKAYGTADRYNRLLHDKSWKSLHRRSHFLLAADDFYFSCLIVNAWIYFKTVTEQPDIDFATFTAKLAHQLYDATVTYVVV